MVLLALECKLQRAPTFRGVFVAAGDLDGDGTPTSSQAEELGSRLGLHATNSRIRLRLSRPATAILRSFNAYPTTYTGGVTVAVGDVNNDGLGDIITCKAGASTRPHIQIFDGGTTLMTSFFAFAPAFRGGGFVACGDTDGDGFDDVIVGGANGVFGNVAVYRGSDSRLATSFTAYITSSASKGSVRAKDPTAMTGRDHHRSGAGGFAACQHL